MASGARDIMPVNSPFGNHTRVIRARIGTVSGLLVGNPVRLNAAGAVVAATATGAEVGSGLLGVVNGPYAASTKNPETGLAWADGDRVAVTLATPGTWFITKNFTTNDSATSSPYASNIGDTCGIAQLSGTGAWCASTRSTTPQIARIMDVLDSKRKTLVSQVNATTATTLAGTYVVFEILASQVESNTTAVAPAA
jgi:hypothetical protein